jgi:TetR/AcrR family transcriptional regulator, regulator of cefoperazone and chloramphenicol sensitivity
MNNMEQAPDGAKLALIEAAGELFGAHGFDGASIRAIAEKAGMNVASINYYFESKEKLYQAVLEYVVFRDKELEETASKWEKEQLSSPEDAADAIREKIEHDFRVLLGPGQPRWFGRMIMRSFLDPVASLHAVEREVFEPGHKALKALFMRARPGMTAEEAQFWAFSLTGQIAFYELFREPILKNLGKDDYDKAFLEAAAEHTIQMMLRALGLVEPLEDSKRPAGRANTFVRSQEQQ